MWWANLKLRWKISKRFEICGTYKIVIWKVKQVQTSWFALSCEERYSDVNPNYPLNNNTLHIFQTFIKQLNVKN